MNNSIPERLLVDNRTGVINSVDRIYYPPGFIPLIVYKATGKLFNDYNKLGDETFLNSYYGMGFSFFSSQKARMSAIGEYVERYCASLVTQEILDKKISEGIGRKLDLEQLTRISEEQARKYNVLNHITFNEETSFYWVEGINVHTLEKVWIPTDLVYLTPLIKNKVPIRDMVSTGTATGISIGDANERGLLECIERDAIMVMWLNKLSMPIIDLKTIENNEIKNIINIIEEMNLKLTVIDITNDIKVPTFFSVIESNHPPYMSTGASTNFNAIEAVIKSITEASACYNFSLNKIMNNQVENFDPSKIHNIDSIERHSDYYAINNSISKISFLFAGEKVSFLERTKNYIKNYSQLISLLQNKNIDVFSVNLTTDDILKAQLNVVKVIVPKFAFLEVSIPMDRCERLKQVPKELGYVAASPLNELLHPFP